MQRDEALQRFTDAALAAYRDYAHGPEARASLDRIASARAVVLGVPSDVGAGFVRGANLGPQAMRTALSAAAPASLVWQIEARNDLRHDTIYRTLVPEVLPRLFQP